MSNKPTLDEILDDWFMKPREQLEQQLTQLIAEAKNDGKIEAVKYAMQFAEKDPEYVTWDFLDGMLSSYEAEQRQRAKERGIEL
jgi:DNA-binding SARP family transcriptional activator